MNQKIYLILNLLLSSFIISLFIFKLIYAPFNVYLFIYLFHYLFIHLAGSDHISVCLKRETDNYDIKNRNYDMKLK